LKEVGWRSRHRIQTDRPRDREIDDKETGVTIVPSFFFTAPKGTSKEVLCSIICDRREKAKTGQTRTRKKQDIKEAMMEKEIKKKKSKTRIWSEDSLQT
jgi:hypothetical protein